MVAVSKIAREKGIRYFLISFSDLAGVARSKLVPAAAIDGMVADGAGFAGFATHLDMTPAHPDMFCRTRSRVSHPAPLETGGSAGWPAIS